MDREKSIVKVSIVGIVVNLVLVAFKAFVGFVTGSIAVILDAVNNLSDALSSVITIIGAKLAGRAPDKEHPYGHGRIEYLSSVVIAVLVLLAGLTSFKESVEKILHPSAANYTTVSLIIIAAAVLTKYFLGRYVSRQGKKLNSQSLIASGADATFDAVLSLSTLVAAAISLLFHLSVEGYLGVIISVVIIRSGIEMLRDAISRIIGERADSDLTRELKKTICDVEGVRGAYDLIVHDYGPDRIMASVHIEVPDYFTADRIDVLAREIMQKVFVTHHVILTAVGIYSHNTSNDEVIALQEEIRRMATSQEYVLQIHGFYMDPVKKTLRFDVVVDFAAPDRQAVYTDLVKKVQALCPDYTLAVALDSDISD